MNLQLSPGNKVEKDKELSIRVTAVDDVGVETITVKVVGNTFEEGCLLLRGTRWANPQAVRRADQRESGTVPRSRRAAVSLSTSDSSHATQDFLVFNCFPGEETV